MKCGAKPKSLLEHCPKLASVSHTQPICSLKMTSIELKSKIEEQGNLIREQQERMDSLISDFFALVPSELAEWMWNTLRDEVQDNHEQAQEMGQAGLSALKTELEDLIESLNDRVKEALADKRLYPHYQTLKHNFDIADEHNRQRKSFYHSRAYTRFANLLGSVLFSHGLKNNFSGSAPTWKPLGNDQFSYELHIEMSQKLKELTQIYNHAFAEFLNLRSALDSITTEVKRAEAVELFDRA